MNLLSRDYRTPIKRLQDSQKTIHEESDIIETPEELARVKAQLKQGKHTCQW